MRDSRPRWHRPVWWGLHALLGLGFGVVLHRFLLRTWVDRPWLFAGWLALLFAVALLCRALAERPPTRPLTLSGSWRRLSRDWLVLLAFFLLLLAIQNVAYQQASSDGRYYFLQVRSMALDLDLSMGADTSPVAGRPGVADNYASGAPLLWLPFYLAAHAWLWMQGLLGADVLLDGYWFPYHRAIGLGTLIYGCTALAMIHDLARRHFSRGLALLATIGLTSASFVGWYIAVESSMSHGVSMFACTLFLWIWERTRGDRGVAGWSALGVAAGLMTLARWQNLLFVVVPAIEVAGIHRARRRDGRPALPTADDLRRYLAFAGTALITFFPQLLIWRVARGGWLAHPAEAHGVDWTRPRVADVLFSSNHGLLSWTPVIWLAVIGLAYLLWRRWRLAWPLVLVFLVQVYVNATVEYWWGGAGFGARRFANCALVFVVGLAALLELCRRRPLLAPATGLAALVLVNSVFMYDVHAGRLPTETRVPADRLLERVYRRTGNPFGFPQNLLVALRMGVGMSFYDQLGSRAYNNLAIDVGAGDREEWLVAGFSAPESSPAGDFRWAVGREARVVVPLRESDDYLVRLRCAPFRYPGAPPQVIRVLANGETVGRIRLSERLQWHEVRVPARHVRAGLNRFDFAFAWARSPADLGINDDSRPLAVRLDRIELLRGGP